MRRSGLCQRSVLGKIRAKESCGLQLGIKAGPRVDSVPQSNRGCRPPGPLHQISCYVFFLVTRFHTIRTTADPQGRPCLICWSGSCWQYNSELLKVKTSWYSFTGDQSARRNSHSEDCFCNIYPELLKYSNSTSRNSNSKKHTRRK